MNLDWLTASPWPILALVLGGGGLLMLAGWRLERRRQADYELLLATGEPAEATVLSAKDSGWRTNGRPHLALELEVRRAGRPPHRATTRLMIHRPWSPAPYPPGARIQVRVDPERPERVALDGAQPILGGALASDLINLGGATMSSFSVSSVTAGDVYIVNGRRYASLDEMPPEARAAFERAAQALGDADGDGLPDGLGAAPAAGAKARLRELKALRDEGLITAEEYEAKKAQILEHL